jgi:hypothetical protein
MGIYSTARHRARLPARTTYTPVGKLAGRANAALPAALAEDMGAALPVYKTSSLWPR